MSETGASTDIWRAALADDGHPRHRAAWLLFSEATKAKASARLLSDQKDEVIPWLYEILDTPELYDAGSLGDGYAPINAVALLGEWQVIEAAPRLIAILDDHDWETIIHDRALQALAALGPAALEPVLAYCERIKDEEPVASASMLADVGKGDARAFQFVLAAFRKATDENDIEFLAEVLLSVDPRQAIPIVEGTLKKRRFSARIQKQLHSALEDARAELAE